jgi:DNA-binding Lrp family transcriptional regulator
MKTSQAPLPLFRSEGQARLLAEAFLFAPPGGLRLTELAARAGLSPGTAHREINRLEEAGILRSHRTGKERRVGANEDSPFYADLRALLMKAFGPMVVLGEALAPVDGIEDAFVFGSWARRYCGERGDAPSDLDVLVVGEPDPDAVYDACRAAEEQAGLPINPTILTRSEWEEGESGFVRQLRRSVLLPLEKIAS